MSLILAKPTAGKLVFAKNYVGTDDPDAATYIAAVEAADGQALETATRVAIHSFVKGCKADGIWNAIKASCILAGARTLAGALVPLVGTAPTNNNFVSGDYNRKTGLVGDGSTKYLDSNRNNNADPQDLSHIAAFVSTAPSTGSRGYIGATDAAPAGSSIIIQSSTSRNIITASRSGTNNTYFRSGNTTTGFIGISRDSAASYTARLIGLNTTYTSASETPLNRNITVFQNSGTNFTNARINFYSIGESLDLALLDSRVTTLINAIGAAIP